MELGIYHEFPVLPGRSQAECFAAGFDIVDASEEYGLDSSSTSTSTAKPGPTPGHPGEAPVYLRCPGFVAKTDAAAQEAYGPTLMRHFQNQSRLLAESSRRQNSPPDHPRWKTSQRLTEITLEETLRGSVFIGSPDTVVGKLKDLQRDIGLSGVQLEINCAGLADHAAEREAIRLLARQVKSAFR
jgi:alkanesulfonate monooxygenase SsuD/methylene tetrahydromethanopterin reductase-like flavin-dependent oxidoreductase (luciferase family)